MFWHILNPDKRAWFWRGTRFAFRKGLNSKSVWHGMKRRCKKRLTLAKDCKRSSTSTLPHKWQDFWVALRSTFGSLNKKKFPTQNEAIFELNNAWSKRRRLVHSLWYKRQDKTRQDDLFNSAQVSIWKYTRTNLHIYTVYRSLLKKSLKIIRKWVNGIHFALYRHHKSTIGHLRVALNLIMKARLSEEFLLWKLAPSILLPTPPPPPFPYFLRPGNKY